MSAFLRGVERRRTASTTEDFRTRVTAALDHAKASLAEWRQRYAEREVVEDIAGILVFIDDRPGERDEVIPANAASFRAMKELWIEEAVKGGAVRPAEPVEAPFEPRLIERIPYVAQRTARKGEITHVLLGAISRWRAPTQSEQRGMQ